MAGVYRPRRPERTVLYRVLFHYFERFLTEYESRLEKEYGFFRPIIKEVVERYLDCGNPRCGFARIRCPDCGEERLVMFSCRTRGFCPSCHAKRLEEWGEWMRETLLLDLPHRQVVFTIPRMLRIFFKYNRRLLGELCRSALRSLTRYFEVVTEGGVDKEGVFHKVSRFDDSKIASLFAREVLSDLVRRELLSPEWAERILSWRHTGFNVHSRVRAKTKKEAERVGKYMIRPILSLDRLSFDEGGGKVCYRYGEGAPEVERMDYLEFIARTTSHIPDKGQVTVRYYGLYGNAHRGKLRMKEEKLRPIPAKGWAERGHVPNSLEFGTCPHS